MSARRGSFTMDALEDVRLDKWLWAARFFKTRSLSHDAIEGGKVYVDGVRAKPSRSVRPGQELRILSPRGEFVITVVKVTDKRGSGAIAATLYEESPESRARREALSVAHRLAAPPAPSTKPNTQERRLLRRIKEGE